MNNLLEIRNNKVVSTKELNQILDFAINKSVSEIEIDFQVSIEKIDIVFFAGLILYHKHNKTTFSITYKGPILDRIFEVRHYLKQFEALYGENWNNTFSKFKGIIELTEKDYYASESYSPIIYVRRNTIDKFFKEKDEAKIGREIFDLLGKYINEKIIGKNEGEIKYLNSKQSIKNELKTLPPIFTFVFTVLYNKIAPFVKTEEKGIENPIQRTEELWGFTKEYVMGLYELAKNIVEHSDTGEGMITIRAYDDAETKGRNNIDKVLETHVFDFGTKGIVLKLIEDTIKNRELSKVYEDDLVILNNKFSMRDFIKPKVITKLNQQLYREIAHYGLMQFYKLIEKNEGIVVSASNGNNDNRDIFTTSESDNLKAITIGTSYYFQLPFKHELFRSSYKDTTPQGDLQGSPQIISGLSELMNLKLIKNINEQSNKSANVKMILDFKSTSIVRNREDEARLFKSFTVLEDSKIEYVSINMIEIDMSASSLLRFLAHLSTKYPQAIILYNLDYELYDEMIENNKQFYQTLKELESGIPYWYENKGILIFCSVKGMNFNFADVLYGNNEKEFQAINHIVSHTFPNTLSITQYNMLNNGISEIPSCLKTFFYQSSLLPFDLLLYSKDNKTLFQLNFETLLSQELKADNLVETKDYE